MSVKLYEGCFGITRGGDGERPKVHKIEWLNGQGFAITVPGWTFFLDDNGFCDGAEEWSIISVHATREEAEAELRRMQGEGATGLFNNLSPEQQAAALAFKGNPDFGPADPVRLDPTGEAVKPADDQRRFDLLKEILPTMIVTFGQDIGKAPEGYGTGLVAKWSVQLVDQCLAALEARQ